MQQKGDFMNRRSFITMLGALSALTLPAFKPLTPKATPTPANEVWDYAQSVAGGTLLELTITSPGGEGYCIVRDMYDNVGYGLGVTPQIALDAALAQLP
jgi:hypothetical protein